MLKALRNVDWSRSNIDLWEGRAMTHGRISKATMNVQLTANLLKQTLGLTLNEAEQLLDQSRAARG